MPDFEKEIVPLLRNDYSACRKAVCCETFTCRRCMVPMRDGVKLETFMYFPNMERDTFPVILNRTCYPHTDPASRLHGEELAKRGYVFIYQYCRGKAGSEGIWNPNVNEREDGIDTIDWICEQPWAGRVGLWGRSYEALVGWAMADIVEGKVSSMFLGAYGTDRFASVYEKGAFRHDVMTSWTMENAGFPVTADYEESCRYQPHAEVDEKLWGGRIDWYRDYVLNEKITDRFWQSGWWRILREIPKKTKIPLYISSGWYDHHHGSSIKTWNRLNAESRAHSTLEVSALNHFQFPCVEDRCTSNDQKKDLDHMFDWFDMTLIRGETPGQMQRFYEIGADRWLEIEGDALRLKDSDRQILYLSQKEQDGKCLCEDCPPKESLVCYIYDPENPVRTHGGESMLHTASEIGSLLQQEPDYRPDVKSFLGEPLQEDLHIFGKIRVKLWVCSDCEDTAFTAKISEVLPDGRTYNIRSAIAVISACRREDDYVPGEAVLLELEMWDIFYQVKAGCRLRLDISSSDFPQYNVHSNYRGKWALQKKTRKASQTILCGGKYDSQVILPSLNLTEADRRGVSFVYGT